MGIPCPGLDVSGPGEVVTARAASKLTLGLRVIGRRADGFHELEALVVSISEPHDLIEIRLTDDWRGVRLVVESGGPPEQASPDQTLVDGDRVPTGATNLAVRAAEMLLRHVDARDVGVDLVLSKGIPVGGGLGGGSADAAAVLVGLRHLLGADGEVDDTTLMKLGAQLGSDVPFCVRGGAAWMRGRGELVEPLDPLGDVPVLVITPPFRLATAEVYAAWDRLGGPRSNRALDPPPAMAWLIPELVNDLEPAAEAVEPRLRGFRDAIEGALGTPALLAGSGASYVVLPEVGTDLAEATAIARAAMPEAAVWCARCVDHGASIAV